RDLADHVHPLSPLLVRRYLDELRAAILVLGVAIDALGRDPQAADVEHLECLANLLRRLARLDQPALALAELLRERRRQAARGVAGTALQEHRLAAVECRLLERGGNRLRRQ